MALFPPDIIPTKIDFSIRNLEPFSRHTFDDGFEVRIAKLSYNDILLIIEIKGAIDVEVREILDLHTLVKGNSLPFELFNDTFFKNHPFVPQWLLTNFNDPLDYDPLSPSPAPLVNRNILWYFETPPRVDTLSVGVYDINFSLRSKRYIFPNYKVSPNYLR